MNILDLIRSIGPMIQGQIDSGGQPQSPTLGGGPQGNPPGVLSAAGQPDAEQDIPAVMAPHQYRGMFGLHGTARDILGTLGDAFLAQGGGHSVYAPRRQMEREANDLRHLVDNPGMAVDALRIDNPDKAMELLHNNTRDNAYAADRASQEEARRQTVEDRARASFSSLGRAANARTWPAIRQRLLQIRERNHLDVPDELLPEQYSDDVPEALLRVGTAPGTQMTADNLEGYRTDRLRQIDEALAERRGYHRDQVGLGHDRVDVARENVGVNRERAGVARAGVDESIRHHQFQEQHPTGRRGRPAGAAPAQSYTEGHRYRQSDGRIFLFQGGQKHYQ